MSYFYVVSKRGTFLFKKGLAFPTIFSKIWGLENLPQNRQKTWKSSSKFCEIFIFRMLCRTIIVFYPKIWWFKTIASFFILHRGRNLKILLQKQILSFYITCKFSLFVTIISFHMFTKDKYIIFNVGIFNLVRIWKFFQKRNFLIYYDNDV